MHCVCCVQICHITKESNNPGSCSEAYESSSIVFKSGDDIKDSKKHIIYKCAERNNEWAHVEGPIYSSATGLAQIPKQWC